MAYGQVEMIGLPGWNSAPRDYGTVLAFWAQIRPLRGNLDSDPKPLGHRSKRNVKTVRKLDDGSIAFRLYATDVVVWHPDERVTVTQHDSASTRAFSCRLLPPNAQLWSDCLTVNTSDSQLYRLDHGDSMVLVKQGRWWVVEASKPWEIRQLDKVKSKEVRARYKLRGWPAWLRAVVALDAVPKARVDGGYQEMREAFLRQDYHRVCELAGRSNGWIGSPGTWVRVARVSSLHRFTSWLMIQEGAVVTISHKVLSIGEYRRFVYNNQFKGL